LASKLAKSANMTTKFFFSKNAEFDAEFESVEKVVKKILRKKLLA
jgi:hypothetical protein